MIDFRHSIAGVIFLSLCACFASAQSRGISIDLRESPSADAPIVETVQLYDESYALVIGIDEYTNGWPRLSNAVKDAEIVAQELEAKGFEVELHRNLDSEEMATTFKRFFTIRGQNPSARLFVWFAGHGMTIEGEGYLVPADAPVPSDDQSIGNFKFMAYFLRDFGGLMRAARSKHAYAVFDACFAGTVFSSARALPPPAITRATTKPVRQFLTSGDANQEVSDDGTFRELFVRAIRGDERADANNDGYVTASELGMYLNDRVTNLTEQAQTPRYGKLRDKNFDLGDFVFVLPGTTPSGEGAPTLARSTPDPEIIFWNSIQGSEDVGEFDAYIAQYPEGKFAELAQARKRALLRKAAQERAAEEARKNVEVTSVDLDMEATSTANVRSLPFPNAPRVGQLQEGADVWVTGETRTPGGLWYQVARDGVVLGFVYSPLLRSVTTVAEYLPIEMLPLPESDVLVAQAEREAVEAETTKTPAEQSIDDEFSVLVDDLLEQVAVEQEASAAPAVASRAIEMATPVQGIEPDAALAEPAATNDSALVQSDAPAAGPEAEIAPARLASPDAELTPASDVDQAIAAAESSATTTRAEPLDTATTESAIETETETETIASAANESDAAGAAEPSLAAAVATTESAGDGERADADNAAVEQIATTEPEAATPAPSENTSAETDAPVETTPAVTATEPSGDAEQVIAMVTEAITTPSAAPPNAATADAAGAADDTIKPAVVETVATEPSATASDDVPPALKRFIVAALSGDSKIQASLGYMYETGSNGVSVDLEEAVRWYTMAANNGEPGAMFNLALLYEHGEGIGGQDLTEAAFWFRRAADSGDLDAQQKLAYMYEQGQGVMSDPTEAVFWYRKAAVAGSPDAQQKLGFMYEKGVGVAEDPLEAARWYEKAALAGRQTAQNNLARLYQLGIGVDKDLDRARYWYEKSAAQGNDIANRNLANLEGE